IMDESVGACRHDGALVEAHGIEIPLLDARDLGGHQRGAVFEILGAMPRPYLELPKMCRHGVEVPLPFVGGCGVAHCGVRERTVELRFDELQRAGGLRSQALRSNRRIKGRCVVPREEASLQPADPIPKLEGTQVRLTLKMVLDTKLVEPLVVQRAERTRQATEVSDERRLYVGAVNVVAECRPSAELQGNFGLLLRLDQGLARE